MRFVLLAALVLFPITAEAAPEVVMFGASWCGPCKTVRAALDHNRVPYRYVDVDSANGGAAYAKARGSTRGIPLLVIGRSQIVGANFDAIGAALVKEGIVKGKAQAPTAQGEYAGQSARAWQSQFTQMRRRLAALEEQEKKLASQAYDNIAKERLEQLREARDLVKASLQQLDNDASRAALPRKYRR